MNLKIKWTNKKMDKIMCALGWHAWTPWYDKKISKCDVCGVDFLKDSAKKRAHSGY